MKYVGTPDGWLDEGGIAYARIEYKHREFNVGVQYSYHHLGEEVHLNGGYLHREDGPAWIYKDIGGRTGGIQKIWCWHSENILIECMDY